MNFRILILLLAVLFVGCTADLSVDYGNDGCHYCKMTIVDQQHAAVAVTDKGKVYKYDAIECMVNHSKETELPFAEMLVNDFNQPGGFLDVKTASFVISENIPSPMGAFLTGFSSTPMAEDVVKEKTGDIYTWQQLQSVELKGY